MVEMTKKIGRSQHAGSELGETSTATPPHTSHGEAQRSSKEPIVQSADLGEMLSDASILMAYAAEVGIPVSEDVRKAVLAARGAQSTGLTIDIAEKLIAARTALAHELSPVTPQSLKAHRTDAEHAVRFLTRTAIALSLLLLFVSAYTFTASALSDANRKDFDTAAILTIRFQPYIVQEAAQGAVLPREGAQGTTLAAATTRRTLRNDIDAVKRTINARNRQLCLFDPWGCKGLSNSDETKPEKEIKLEKDEDKINNLRNAVQDGRTVGANVSLLTSVIASTILPALYAVFGACAFLLINTIADIRQRRFIRSQAYWGRLALAAMAGQVVGLFNFAITSPVSASPLAIAFLVGYSTEIFFAFLQSVVANFTRISVGPGSTGSGATDGGAPSRPSVYSGGMPSAPA